MYGDSLYGDSMEGKSIYLLVDLNGKSWKFDVFEISDDSPNGYVCEISVDSANGYVLEVDLEYPQNLHDLHKDLPLVLEHRSPPNWKIKKIIDNSLR